MLLDIIDVYISEYDGFEKKIFINIVYLMQGCKQDLQVRDRDETETFVF